jgi:hypothetical protein
LIRSNQMWQSTSIGKSDENGDARINADGLGESQESRERSKCQNFVDFFEGECRNEQRRVRRSR